MLYMTGFPLLAKSPPAFDIHQQWGSKLAYNPVKAGFMFAFCIFHVCFLHLCLALQQSPGKSPGCSLCSGPNEQGHHAPGWRYIVIQCQRGGQLSWRWFREKLRNSSPSKTLISHACSCLEKAALWLMPNSGSRILPVMFLWKCLFLHAGEEEEEDRGSHQLLELKSFISHLMISLRMSQLRRKSRWKN